jgi:hypothetical protein
LSRIEEFVGVSGGITDQAMRGRRTDRSKPVEGAVLHSIEIASRATLTSSQHAEHLHSRGLTAEMNIETVQLTLASGVNRQVHGCSHRRPHRFDAAHPVSVEERELLMCLI